MLIELQFWPIHTHSCANAVANRLRRVVDASDIPALFCGFSWPSFYLLKRHMSWVSSIQDMFPDKGNTLQVSLAFGNTLPCYRTPEMKFLRLSGIVSDSPHPTLHGLSKATREHCHIVPFGCRLVHFRLAQAKRGEFPLKS